MYDWNKRINELTSIVNDVWQLSRYTPKDAFNENVTVDGCVKMFKECIYEEYGHYAKNYQEYDKADCKFIDDLLTLYVKSVYEALREGE